MNRRISRRLYLFPALLPLAEIVPLLLGAMGAVAGVAGFSFRDTWVRHRYKMLSIALVLFMAAGAVVVYYMPDRDLKDAGSRLIPEDQLPKTVYFEAPEDPAAPEASEAFAEARSQAVGKQILAPPVISNGVLVTATYKGTVEAYRPRTLKPLWSITFNEPIIALTEKDGVSYVGEGLHHTRVAALTAVRHDGKILWRREIVGHVEEPAAILPEEGMVLTGSGPGGLWALDIDKGIALWHAQIGHMDSRPFFHEGVIYAHAQNEGETESGFLYAIDAKEGKVLWRVSLPGQPWGEPVLLDDGKTLLTTTGRGQIGVLRDTDAGWAHTISIPEKKVIWSREIGGMPLQPGLMIRSQHASIHTLKSGEVVAIEPDDGNMLWRLHTGSDVQASGALSDTPEPLVAVVSFEGFIHIIRAKDGVLLAKREVPKGSTSSPLFDGDELYVATPYNITVFKGIKALAATK